MAGIYVHIPICASRCYYCDFYSSTYRGNRESLVRSICEELKQRRDYLKGELVKTIYFGGGTPSQLTIEELRLLIDTILQNFPCEEVEEVTLEANPEDLFRTYLEELKSLGINRLSIGIQSFSDDDLRLINRRHTAKRALQAVEDAQSVGFANISIDLIYGLPHQSMEGWQRNVQQAIALGVPHVSAYSLTFEEHSMLTKMRDKGEIQEADEELSLSMFKYLRKELTSHGIFPYEISNFARVGYESKHNSSYWNYVPYLGVGPSAHSFDGDSRRWNVSNTREYIRLLAERKTYYEEESLDLETRYNEYVMTSLRKAEGVEMTRLISLFGESLADYFRKMARCYLDEGKMIEEKGFFRLSEEGIFISDFIIEDLLRV